MENEAIYQPTEDVWGRKSTLKNSVFHYCYPCEMWALFVNTIYLKKSNHSFNWKSEFKNEIIRSRTFSNSFIVLHTDFIRLFYISCLHYPHISAPSHDYFSFHFFSWKFSESFLFCFLFSSDSLFRNLKIKWTLIY